MKNMNILSSYAEKRGTYAKNKHTGGGMCYNVVAKSNALSICLQKI